MKFFNRLSQHAENSQNQPNQWESLNAAVQLPPTEIITAEELNAQNQARQERKIISAFLGNPQSMHAHDVAINDTERMTFYQSLVNGNINQQQKSAFLQNIVTPSDRSPENVLAKLSDKHERRILAYLSGAGFNNWEQLSLDHLTTTLQQFPTPYELADVEQNFLNSIQQHNSPEKFLEYQTAMDSFKQKFYGKRLEYYNSLESLQDEANQLAKTASSRAAVLEAYHPEKTPKPIELHKLAPAEAQEILTRSKIDGDNFIYDGTSYQLTPQILEQAGLAPNFSFQLENANISLSSPYQVGAHTAVMAYVATAKGTKICSYYRSNSQGNWRLLPDYVSNRHNPEKPIDWFGKGYSEESLNLPSATQYALEVITNQQAPMQPVPANAAFYFAGTAKRYESKDDYHAALLQGKLHGDHYREVARLPQYNFGELQRFSKANPRTLDLTGTSAPDFATSNNRYYTKTDLYGSILVDHVDSQDRKLQYTFNRNHNNQAWLGSIEVETAPLSSDGLRTAWVSAGDCATPLYEYMSQSSGYGDPRDIQGRYISMWSNYLSRMPLIQKYLASRKS